MDQPRSGKPAASATRADAVPHHAAGLAQGLGQPLQNVLQVQAGRSDRFEAVGRHGQDGPLRRAHPAKARPPLIIRPR